MKQLCVLRLIQKKVQYSNEEEYIYYSSFMVNQGWEEISKNYINGLIIVDYQKKIYLLSKGINYV